MKRKLFDIAVFIAVAASAAAAFFIIRDFTSKSEERSAAAVLEKTASMIESDLAVRFAAIDPASETLSDGLFDSFASVDLSSMTVKPQSLAGRVFARTDIRPQVFDAATLARLKSALGSGDASAREAALSYYLDSRPDYFALEKAILYVHLIELKKSAGKPFDREYISVKNLMTAVSNQADRKFIADKIRFITAAAPETKPGTIADIFSLKPSASEAEDFEGAGALAEALARDAVTRPAGAAINVISVGGRPRLLISGAIARASCGAAFLNTQKLNLSIAAKYGATVCDNTPQDHYAVIFRGSFLLASPASNFSDGFSPGRAAPYIPLLVIIAAFLYIRIREREAAKLSLAMTDFASRISHQLKTPLSAALLYLELAERHFKDGDQKKAGEMLAAAGSQAHSLSFLFENFSALNRIFSDGVKLFPEITELKEELYKFFKAYSYDVESGKVAIAVDIADDLLVSIDRWAFYNILNNLVSNSIKYSGKAPVNITLSAADKGDYVVLSIADDGAGISGIDRERIFEKFFKGSNAANDQRSSGLGLYIAASLATRMGGSLSFDASCKGGAKFDLAIRRGFDA